MSALYVLELRKKSFVQGDFMKIVLSPRPFWLFFRFQEGIAE
jgi:hypothetical protein